MVRKRDAKEDILYLFLLWDTSLFMIYAFQRNMNSLCSFSVSFCSFSSLVSVCVSVSLRDDDSVKIELMPVECLLKCRCSEMFSPSHLPRPLISTARRDIARL